MPLQRVFGAVMKRLLLRPRVSRATWPQLCAAAAVSHDRFSEMLSGMTEAGAAVEAAGERSPRDTLAHLAGEYRAFAATLEALRLGRPAPPAGLAGMAAAPDATWDEVRADYAASWKRLTEAAAQPIASAATADHALFGPLTAAEWLALVAYQHELHARQMERVMRSEAYRQAQGARW